MISVVKVKNFYSYKEISKSKRYFFCDNGIRNAIINNFSTLEERHDSGELFENFIFSELIFNLTYLHYNDSLYYWRTKAKTEIDFINGYIVKKAQEIDLEAPLNSFLVKAIREIENKKREIGMQNLEEIVEKSRISREKVKEQELK